ncbi:hypothetical protein [Methanobacterium alcaliphilum]|nr:hypothetical protein [Methanobacterium alcaliphilum]
MEEKECKILCGDKIATSNCSKKMKITPIQDEKEDCDDFKGCCD